MTLIRIPATVEEAQAELDGLGALLTAKEWHRAAIVYAFTKPDTEPRFRGNQHTVVPPATGEQQIGLEPFARLGLTGLRKAETVAAYRRNWQTAIDDGQAQPVKPGDKVELPTRDWPPTKTGGVESSPEAGLRAIKRNPHIVLEALADPDTFEAVTDDLSHSPVTVQTVTAKARSLPPPPKVFVNEDGEVRVNMEQMLKDANQAAANAPLAALYRILSAAQILRSNWTPELLDRLDADDMRRMDRDVVDVIATLNKVLILIEQKASVA